MKVSASARSALLGAVLLFSGALYEARGQSVRIEGAVTDVSGAPIARAQVTLTAPGQRLQTSTSANGSFVFNAPPVHAATIAAAAPGFSVQQYHWTAGERFVTITLSPATLTERMTVTATGEAARVSDTAANVVVLSQQDVASTAAFTLDEVLRQVPGFSLFRRTGSEFANPTAQGVSLRGLGASGASRAIVLQDGVPLNDPFGGWVYWSRVPRVAVEDVEVLRGGASDLYGTGALGGVIQVFENHPNWTALSLDTSLGGLDTGVASALANANSGDWDFTVTGETFGTDGYILVPESQRGSVDTPANSEHQVGQATLSRGTSDQSLVFISGNIFRESRDNGTPLQTNQTHLAELRAGADFTSDTAGRFSARAYGTGERYWQTFSSIATDRTSESLTRTQLVPSTAEGLTLNWSRTLGSAQTLLAGAEGLGVHGDSREFAFVSSQARTSFDTGGSQRTVGAFAEDVVRFGSRLLITGAARYDHWSNDNGFSATAPLTRGGTRQNTRFANRNESAVSPRLSVLGHVTQRFSFAASAYRAFRAPTLNELYRSFRVGNILTNANTNLLAERLTGGEASGILSSATGKLSARATAFWEVINRPIANVTLSTTPQLITRMRENLGRTQSRGAELDSECRITSRLFVAAGYEYADATVASFPADPTLVGKWIPQSPRHAFTLQGRYAAPGHWTFALQGQAFGRQYDDDQNLLPLNGYAAADVFAARTFASNIEVYGTVQNLFNNRYEVGRTPTPTAGPPITARIGLRLNLPAR